MPQSQHLSLEQRQQLRLTQQQLRFVKLLEDSAQEFDDAVARELEDNPALEVKENDSEPATSHDEEGGIFGESAEQLQRADYMRTEDIPYLPQRREPEGGPFASSSDSGESLLDHLMEQLANRQLSTRTRAVAEYIAGNLDDNGYLSRTAEQISDDLAFGPGIDVSPEEVQEALEVVRSLDPAGVGAYDLRDTLLLQLQRMPESQTRDDAIAIISDHFREFAMKHTPQLVNLMKVGRERVDDALALILTLNPKPGGAFEQASSSANVIIPDFIVTSGEGEDEEPVITLNNRIPDLQVDRTFSQAVAELTSAKGRTRRKGAEFIVDRTNEARDFIRLVRQRQETLMRVMAAIVEYQRDYFRTGDVYDLRPMLIRNLADRTGEDISVISRATKNKYVQTPYGMVPLRFFFSDTIGEEEEGKEQLTNRKIEASIRELTENEDKKKPLSDDKIREALAQKGFDVSRRTIAKYRDRLGIPVARLRKTL